MQRAADGKGGVRILATMAAIAAVVATAAVVVIGLDGPRTASAAPAGSPAPAAPAPGAKPAPAGKPKAAAGPEGKAGPAPEKSGPHWGYEGAEGPEHWGDLDPAYATCKTGALQSPIDIQTAKLTATDLDSIRFFYKPMPLDVVDTGHSIQMNFEPGCAMKVNGVPYSLLQVHFHHPSEEQINGKSFPMVAHMVHKSADGKLAVIAVLLTTGKANPALDEVIKSLPSGHGNEAKSSSLLVDPTLLLPSVRNYYTFQGSLTTPPCTEGVTWFVLKNQASLSAEQEQALAKRYAHNARPIQPAHDRKIQASE